MPFVKTDYFLSESQFDSFQTNFYCNTSPIEDTQMMQNGFDSSTATNAGQTEACFNNFQQARSFCAQLRAAAADLPFLRR